MIREDIKGVPQVELNAREPTRAALHVALLVLISGLDSPVSVTAGAFDSPPPSSHSTAPSLSSPLRAPSPSFLPDRSARIFCLAAAR